MRPSDYLRLSVVAFLVLLLWFFTPWIVRCWAGDGKSLGEFGDIFGAVNALFSGLAFAGVCAALILQHRGLREANSEVQRQLTALMEQMRMLRASALVAVTQPLLEEELQHVETAHKPQLGMFLVRTAMPPSIKAKVEALRKQRAEMLASGKAKESPEVVSLGCLVGNLTRIHQYKETLRQLHKDLENTTQITAAECD